MHSKRLLKWRCALEFEAVLDTVKGLVEQLPKTDQTRLLEELTAWISQREKKPLYNVLDFEGIARGTWDDVGGVDEFLKQERASWDEEYG
jgi:hypothetical protein